MKIEFQNYKQAITNAIQKRVDQSPIPGENGGFTLIEGFIMQPLSQNLGDIVLGGPTVPLVAIVGKNSGRVYYFALKALNIDGLENV